MRGMVIVLGGILLITGCSSSHELKPGMVHVYTEPSISCERDPGAAFDSYISFTTLPLAEGDKTLRMNVIVEKQLLFIIRNNLEVLGYRYVDDLNEADICITVLYANEYESQFVPPQTYTTQRYVPGQTQTAHINLYGPYGSSWGTATTMTPGYFFPVTVTVPGHYVGATILL
ncbi:MAG: DUF4136 domain-containing protein [Phycisphaerae bacterium]|nr:DUF4136 domain-containing protein [Phycisphaerae bacterium]